MKFLAVSFRLFIAALLLTVPAKQNLQAQCTGFPATVADGDCAGGMPLSNNANINSGTNWSYCASSQTNTNFSGVNLAGGTLRICGNATLSGNWNSGVIVVSCGSTLTFSNLTLNSNVGIINYGTININGNLTYQNSNNYVYNETASSQLNVTGNISYPVNNGQTAYLKNAGSIKINGTFNAMDGGYTCFMDGGTLETNNLVYLNQTCPNAPVPTHRFTFGSSTGTASLRYTGNANLKSSFTNSANWIVYRASGSSQSLVCSGSWGNATVVTNAPAFAPAVASSCTSVSATCVTALPVDLIHFNGFLSDETVYLNWKTAMELNNDYFTIQKSSDGRSWTDWLKVKGEGNSKKAKAYEARDEHPAKGANYYRLKQTDLDGSFTYFHTIVIHYQYASKISSTVYPNPAKDQLKLELTSPPPGEITIEFMNTLGQTEKVETALVTEPVSVMEWSLQTPSVSGSYILRLSQYGVPLGAHLVYINR